MVSFNMLHNTHIKSIYYTYKAFFKLSLKQRLKTEKKPDVLIIIFDLFS